MGEERTLAMRCHWPGLKHLFYAGKRNPGKGTLGIPDARTGAARLCTADLECSGASRHRGQWKQTPVMFQKGGHKRSCTVQDQSVLDFRWLSDLGTSAYTEQGTPGLGAPQV